MNYGIDIRRRALAGLARALPGPADPRRRRPGGAAQRGGARRHAEGPPETGGGGLAGRGAADSLRRGLRQGPRVGPQGLRGLREGRARRRRRAGRPRRPRPPGDGAAVGEPRPQRCLQLRRPGPEEIRLINIRLIQIILINIILIEIVLTTIISMKIRGPTPASTGRS